MEKYELLIRAMHTAQCAREKGFECLADAMDELVQSIARLIDYDATRRKPCFRKE